MSSIRDTFLYFLWDKDGKSYTVDPNGSVAAVSTPTWLKHKPIGWQDIELSFDTVDKYFSNVKALSVPLQYVLDGAKILRYLLYKGKGFEEEVYCVIFKMNPDDGVHYLEYKGRIDLTTSIDDPNIGVTVNGKEGGFQADLDALEDVTYELKLDGTNPDALNCVFDGVNLRDKYNYEFYEVDLPNYINTVGVVYLNNEGDSIGIVHGDQAIDDLAGGYDFANSANTPFYSVKPLVSVGIEGTIEFNFQDGVSVGDGNSQLAFILKTNLQEVVLVPQSIYNIPGHVFDFSGTFDLAAGERIFFVWATNSLEANGFKVVAGKFSLTFTSINDNSQAFLLPPLAIFNQLVKRWNPKYSVVSDFFSTHNNICATSGQSLRNLSNPVLKYSFTNAWDDYNKQYCLCLNIIGNVMYIEKRDVRFASNSSNVIFDLGTLSSFSISPDASTIVSTIKIGWPDQTYDERNGKFEFNSTNEEKAPVSSKKAEDNLVGKARGDCFGIEFIRGALNNKDTTDNEGDNQVFLVNIVPNSSKLDGIAINWAASTKILKLFSRADLLASFPVGQIFETVSDLPDFNYFVFSVVSATVNGSDLDIVVNENPPATSAGFTGSILFPCKLKRTRYDAITGITTTPVIGGVVRTDLPGAIFNYDEMSPVQRLKNWGSWLRSVLFQLPAGKITFQTALKNADITTTLNGKTISEKADIQVSSLAAPFFLNYNGKFTVKTPLTFNKTLSTLNSAGVIKGNYNGFPLEFIPRGKMSSKPATDNAEEWQLTLSINNNLNTLYLLSEEGLYINDGMNNTLRASILTPVHSVYYNKQLNAKYKYKDMFDDWVHHRNNQFAVQPGYAQKWEFADTIPYQYVTNGITQLDLYIYDADAALVDTLQFDIITDQAVRQPYALQQLNVDPSDYAEGFYLFVLKAGAEILLISEWQHLADVHDGTYLIEYFNSYNKQDAFFSQFRPMIRVEAMWGIEKFEGSSSDYKDETGHQTLYYDTDSSKTLHFGDPYGIPDWMHAKLNSILRVDNLKIEGESYVCTNDSKWDINERSGYPLNTYAIDLRRSNKSIEIAVTSTGGETEPSIIYTLDAEGFGQAPGLIELEVQPD